MPKNDDQTTRVIPRDQPPPDPTDQLNPGDVIKDRFIIESVIGRGGMGVVYRARDRRKEEAKDRDPYVALKVLGEKFRRDPRMVIALQREARKAQTLAHPNITTVYDFDRDDERVYMTMEVLDGQSLDQVIRENPQGLDKARALKIIRGLCLGLAYAHNKNIIHSDFKPSNVFLTTDDGAKILDFGIARATPAGDLEGSETTQFDAGELGALTPSYASVEMFAGKDPDPADDVYGLAVVAYQLLSGRHPFDYTPAPDALKAGTLPAHLKGLNRRESKALERGLAFDRESRSANAAAFLRDLEGTPRVFKVLASAIVLLALTGGYVVYNEVQKNIQARPEIAFEALPAATQDRFAELLTDGDTFQRFGDLPAALDRFTQAYRMHPRNRAAVTRVETLIETLVERNVATASYLDLTVMRDNLQAVMEIDEFLGARPTLVSAMTQLTERLEVSAEQSR
jgi:tRNA A-37 threonylcarbamoyl transferase component Bud32